MIYIMTWPIKKLCNREHVLDSVAIPHDRDVIFGYSSKTIIAQFKRENSRKYFISAPIFLRYTRVYGGKYKLSTDY